MNKKIALKTKDSLLVVDIKDIIYFEKEKKNIKVVLKNKNNLYIKNSMKNLQYILENENLYNIYFFKPHCSFMINAVHISAIKSTQVIMSNRDFIPISHSNRKNFSQLIKSNLYMI